MTFINKLLKYFFLWKIQREKIKLLREVDLDREFFVKCKNADGLLEKVGELRKNLKEEQSKEDGKKDYSKINEISFKIAMTEKVMRDYTTTLQNIEDLIAYISMIKDELNSL